MDRVTEFKNERRPRDSRRKKYYKAEHQWYSMLPASHMAKEWLTNDQVAELVQDILTRHIQSPLDPDAVVLPNPYDIEIVFRRRNGAAWFPVQDRLVFGMTYRWLVLHEVAHVLSTNLTQTFPRESWHAWRWAKMYLKLVRMYIGASASLELRAQFERNNLPYEKPDESIPKGRTRQSIAQAARKL